MLASVFRHAMYPITADSRYISSPTLCPITKIPHGTLKMYYKLRLTCQELLVELEKEAEESKKGTIQRGTSAGFGAIEGTSRAVLAVLAIVMTWFTTRRASTIARPPRM